MVIVEILLILAFTAFCIRYSSAKILCLMFLLLPVHGTIKFMVFGYGGNIFAMWKEIGIMAILIKTWNAKSLLSNNIKPLLFLFFSCSAIFMIVGFTEGFKMSSSIKRLVFPPLLALAASKIPFTQTSFKNLLLSIFVGSIVINITGVADFLSPSTRMIFRDMMRVGYVIAEDGTIYYDVSSFAIMGLDRASGLMAGGPNQLGVFNCGILMFCLIALLFFKKMFITQKQKFVLYAATVMSTFLLLVSFSRAGWAMVAIAFFILIFKDKRMRKYAVGIAFTGILCLVFAVSLIPQVSTVVEGTFSGNEASSAARADMTQNSLDKMLENPFGYGLGASDRTNKNYKGFAESSMINTGFETGVEGILILSMVIFCIIKLCYKNRFVYVFAPFGYSFFIAYYITSWVSVNPFENPFVYYAWGLVGLSLNKSFTRTNIENWKCISIK